MDVTPPPVPFAPVLTGRIAEAATRCLARLARPQRRALVRGAEQQRRVDVAAQVEARTHERTP